MHVSLSSIARSTTIMAPPRPARRVKKTRPGKWERAHRREDLVQSEAAVTRQEALLAHWAKGNLHPLSFILYANGLRQPQIKSAQSLKRSQALFEARLVA